MAPHLPSNQTTTVSLEHPGHVRHSSPAGRDRASLPSADGVGEISPSSVPPPQTAPPRRYREPRSRPARVRAATRDRECERREVGRGMGRYSRGVPLQPTGGTETQRKARASSGVTLFQFLVPRCSSPALLLALSCSPSEGVPYHPYRSPTLSGQDAFGTLCWEQSFRGWKRGLPGGNG